MHEWTLLSRRVLARQGLLWIMPGMGPLISKQSTRVVTLVFLKAKMGWWFTLSLSSQSITKLGSLQIYFLSSVLGGVSLHSWGSGHKHWKPDHPSHSCHTIPAWAVSSTIRESSLCFYVSVWCTIILIHSSSPAPPLLGI